MYFYIFTYDIDFISGSRKQYWLVYRDSKQLFTVSSPCKLWTFKDVSHVQSHKLAPMSGIHHHLCAFSTSGCALVYFTVQYYIEYSIFISSQWYHKASKRRGDIAGTVPYFSRYCTVRLKMFYFLCLFVFNGFVVWKVL